MAGTRHSVKRMNSRRMARHRYERMLADTVFAGEFLVEILRTIEEGRIPLEVAHDALTQAQETVYGRMMSDTPSWGQT